MEMPFAVCTCDMLNSAPHISHTGALHIHHQHHGCVGGSVIYFLGLVATKLGTKELCTSSQSGTVSLVILVIFNSFCKRSMVASSCPFPTYKIDVISDDHR